MSTATTDICFTVKTPADLAATEGRVRELLGAQGFGVLTEIDVQETLRTKIGVEMGGYKILGACNPQLASRAIAAKPEVGVMLPCNVVLRETGDATLVEIADPIAMLGLIDDPDVAEIAMEARDRLMTVAAALQGI